MPTGQVCSNEESVVVKQWQLGLLRDLNARNLMPLTKETHKEHVYQTLNVKVLVVHSCPTLFEPMDCSSPGSSVHGISQARILEWRAIPFSRDLPHPGIESRSLALQEDSLPSE